MKYIRLIIFNGRPRNASELRYKFQHRKKKKLVNPWGNIKYDEIDIECINWVNSL